MTTQVTPLGAVARGLAAGAVGTACMTLAQELSARLQSSQSDDQQGDDQQGDDQQNRDAWAQASMPAKVARRISRGVFERDVPPERIPLLTNAVHWAYGTAWGAVYGLVQETFGGRPLRRGVAFATGVWAMSYVQLVPMGLYEPPWRYPRKDVAMELSYHLAYGLGVAGAYPVLDRA